MVATAVLETTVNGKNRHGFFRAKFRLEFDGVAVTSTCDGVKWWFDLSLLMGGISRPTGEGDVRVSPRGDQHVEITFIQRGVPGSLANTAEAWFGMNDILLFLADASKIKKPVKLDFDKLGRMR